MKHSAATVVMIGLLAAFPAGAAKPAGHHPKPHLTAAQKKFEKARRKNLKAQKAAVRRAKARKPAKG